MVKKFSRRAFVKKGALLVPALYVTRKSIGQVAFTFGDMAFGTRSIANTAGGTWADAVEINGGTRPGNTSINAVQTYIDSMTAAGLYSGIYAWLPVAPDNIIAATTPAKNLDKPLTGWSMGGPDGGFDGADLSVNGILGDGSNYIITNLSNQDIETFVGGPVITTSFGMDFYVSLATNSNSIEMGVQQTPAAEAVDLLCQFAGVNYWDSPQGNRISFAPSFGERLVMGNRTSVTDAQIYDYNSTHAVTSRVSGGGDATGAAISTGVYFIFACNRGPVLASDKRGSYAAIRRGFTLSELQTYAPIVQQFRTDLGGGFV